MTSITQWKGKTFYGNQFTTGIYDESYSILDMHEIGLPYAMACFEISPSEVIAIGVDRSNQSPMDFIEENQNSTFVLDSFKQSRKFKTRFGETLVHYAKRVTNKEQDSNTELDLEFFFHSSDHLRLQDGKQISGPHGGAPRIIKVGPNTSGNTGYTVTLFNTEGYQVVVQMEPKQMKLVKADDKKIQLKGYGQDKTGSSFTDYGLTIFHDDGNIEKCVLHMYDRDIDIEYLH